MNFESIKRRLELSDIKKPTDEELREYTLLMPVEGGIWAEAKHLVTLVENWSKRAKDAEATIQRQEVEIRLLRKQRFELVKDDVTEHEATAEQIEAMATVLGPMDAEIENELKTKGLKG